MATKDIWRLRLYIVGDTIASRNASANLQALCDERLNDRCDVEVIDILKNPEVASDEQIVATPTLVKQSPLPIRRFVGDLSNKERLLVDLGIKG